MSHDPNDIFPGAQPVNHSYWFGHVGASGPTPAGSWPVTPNELAGKRLSVAKWEIKPEVAPIGPSVAPSPVPDYSDPYGPYAKPTPPPDPNPMFVKPDVPPPVDPNVAPSPVPDYSNPQGPYAMPDPPPPVSEPYAIPTPEGYVDPSTQNFAMPDPPPELNPMHIKPDPLLDVPLEDIATGVGSRFRPRQLGQAQTVSVFVMPGGGAPTALVLGPSSWGFGIGHWGSTAHYVPQQFPSHAHA